MPGRARGGMARVLAHGYIPGIANNRKGRVLRYLLMLPMFRLGNLFAYGTSNPSPQAARRD